MLVIFWKSLLAAEAEGLRCLRSLLFSAEFKYTHQNVSSNKKMAERNKSHLKPANRTIFKGCQKNWIRMHPHIVAKPNSAY